MITSGPTLIESVPTLEKYQTIPHHNNEHSHTILLQRITWATLLISAFVLSSSLLMAQSGSTGSIVGTVTDNSGAVIVGANVVATDMATSEKRTTTSNDAGRYVLANLPPGPYQLEVTRAGFKLAKATQSVEIGMVATVNVAMQIGAVTQEVVVEATGAQLQTMNATIGTTMNFDMAQALPGLSRDVSGLALMQPATTPMNGTSGQAGSVAGSNADQNMFVLDGGNNSSDMDGTNTVYLNGFAGNPITGGGSAIPNGVVPTPVESIEEFKVGVAGQTADFNAAAGSQVTMATRRGGSMWHGTGYEYYYGTNFSANSWSNGHTPSTDPHTGALLGYTPLPSRHQNRFGASAGGPVLPFNFLGGKTYLFGFYQGVRFPNVTTLEKATPSALMRAGVIQIQNSSGSPITLNGTTYGPNQWMPFNLNPNAVTVNGVTYQPTNVCGPSGTSACDPRGIGLNAVVNTLWSQYMPVGNDLAPPSTIGDSFNTVGYKNTIRLPQNDNNWVARLDHDFGQNWHLMSSYRYYKLSQASTGQVDVGGILGGAKGQYVSTRNLPSLPSIFVVGLSTTLGAHITNDFHYSYTRNWWQWGDAGAPPQPISGLGGALEVGGELSTGAGLSYQALNPYNVDTQDVRTRFWDGEDHMLRDDVNWLKGNHLFQFGGSYQRNWDFHDRNDNGQGTMAANVYQITDSAGINWSGFLPPTSVLPSSQQGAFQSLAAQVFGIVGQPQTLYTRAGTDLHLLPLGTHAQDKDTIPYYSVYWSDTWHMKPTFTLTYGLSYAIEMPPYEESGKQVMLVDQSDNPVRLDDYLSKRKAAALAGQVYDPVLGFALVGNVNGHPKYPYDPFYGGVSPRVAIAWSPRFDSGILGSMFGDSKSVLRIGYSRIYGRLNGVNQVLVPLLGTGIMQAVSCVGASINGRCLGTGGVTPASAFRIGTDGLVAPLGSTPSNTLAQPFFSGVGGNLAAAPGSGLDPGTRPSVNDSFTLSIQREVSRNLFVEAGYIGKIINNEFQEVNMDAVPYMTTLGGQTFANAYANIYTAICGLNVQVCPASNVSTPAPQPFIEAALGGSSSPFCSGKSSCTAALIAAQRNLIASNRVYELWNAMETSTSWTLGRTNPGMNPPGGCPAVVTPTTVCRQFQAFDYDASNGYGNYNGAFATVTFRNFHGVTARSNFTWGRSFGTGGEVQARSTRTVLDPWNLDSEYGPNGFDVKFIYNLALNYEPSFHKNQQGIVGHLLGGWSISPLFTAQSGFPLNVVQQDGTGSSTSREAFGQSDPSQSAIYNVVLTNGTFNGGNSLHYFTSNPSGSVGTTATSKSATGVSSEWLNIFADPSAAYSQFRRLILGIDERGNGFGILRGFPRWNLDLTVAKDIRMTERFGLNFTAMMTNVLNHFQPDDPSMNLNSPATFGRVSAQATGYDSRQIEFGLKFRW
jgi:hypothetical protein